MHTICVFCGSARGFNQIYGDVARLTGAMLARRKVRIVYGAGNIGLMGILADAALENQGEVLGVIPRFLKEKEVCHTTLSGLIITTTMHQRKEIMAGLSDGFLILPGGYGTLDEFFEILTWRQLHLHNKPIGILNINGFYDNLLAHLRQLWREGFLRESNLSLVTVADNLPELLQKMAEEPTASSDGKWIQTP